MQDLMPPINTPDSAFHDGDPTTGQLGTIVTALWLNNVQAATRDVQLEIKNVLAKAGIQPDPKKTNQLTEAISQIIGSGNYASTAYVDNGLNKKFDKANISGQKGNDNDKVPSLNLFTNEIGKLASKQDVDEKIPLSSIANSLGTSKTWVMSQDIVTRGLAGKLDNTKPVFIFPEAIIQTKSNLNDYRKNGDFIFSNDAVGSNFPDSWGGHLKVRETAYGRVDQIFTTYSTETQFIRSLRAGDVFSKWEVFYTSGNTKIDRNGYLRVASSNTETIGVPVGSSIIWNTSAPIPDNFWPNEGRSFSASEYPELAKIFPNLKLPDDRGYAIRAADNGRGKDPGRTVGTYQDDAMRNLTGWMGDRDFRSLNTSDYIPFVWGHEGVFKQEKRQGANGAAPRMEAAGAGNWTGTKFDASLQVPTADEFRMKNVAKILITRVK
ncbi:pyocin knob domain-containing protein [Providencia rettgeri]